MTSNQPLPPPAPDPIPAIAVPLLSLAGMGSGMHLRVTDSMLPFLASEFQVGLGEASYAVTVFAIAYGLAQFFLGPIGDRFGKYRTIGWACLASAFTAMLSAFALDFPMLLVARFLSGICAAAIMPLSLAWIGDVVPYEKRHPVLARFLIGQIVGLSVGVLIGGVAADAGSYGFPFASIAAIFLFVGLAALFVDRRLPVGAKRVQEGLNLGIAHTLAGFLSILNLPWARIVLLGVVLEGGFLYGAFAFIPAHMHREHGLSLTSAGALILLFGCGGVFFATASGPLAKRLTEAQLALCGGATAALSLIAIGLAPVWWLALPGCFGTGVGFYMLHTTLQINATQMAPERRGAAVSTFAACFFLGQSTGVGLAGLSVEHAGTGLVIASGGCGVLAAAVFFARRLKRRSLS